MEAPAVGGGHSQWAGAGALAHGAEIFLASPAPCQALCKATAFINSLVEMGAVFQLILDEVEELPQVTRLVGGRAGLPVRATTWTMP